MSPPTGILVLVISHSTALITTILRLVHRFQTRRLWWDDFWALIALIFDAMVLILFLAIPPYVYGNSHSLQQFWKLGTMLASATALWAARLSVGVTIVRLLTAGPFRNLSMAMNYVFGLLCIGVVVFEMTLCSVEGIDLPYCPFPPLATGLVELITDVFGDIWLLFAPCYMLWRIKLSRRYKRLLLAIFACGILTTGACLAHIIFLFKADLVWIGMTAHVQIGTSIVVCNLLVLVTYVYRVFWNTHGDNDSTQSSEEISSSRGAISRDQPQTAEYTRPRQTVDSSVASLTDLGSNFGNTMLSTYSTDNRYPSQANSQISERHSSFDYSSSNSRSNFS